MQLKVGGTYKRGSVGRVNDTLRWKYRYLWPARELEDRLILNPSRYLVLGDSFWCENPAKTQISFATGRESERPGLQIPRYTDGIANLYNIAGGLRTPSRQHRYHRTSAHDPSPHQTPFSLHARRRENRLRPAPAILTNTANGILLVLCHNVRANVAASFAITNTKWRWRTERMSPLTGEGRPRSVAGRKLCMAVAGGHVPLPPIMFNVSAVTKDEGAERLKWRITYS